jgi:cytochrome c-type biogenesis protein CcmH/NrfG
LWAFAAASAGRAGDKATADSLLGSLRSGGPISPDGWFWMSVAYRVLGERGEATAAMAAAKRLAPFLTTSLFERRLLGGR